MALSENTQLKVVNSIDTAHEMLEWFNNTEATILGLDTETSGTPIFQPDFRLRTIQIGDRENGWMVDFERWGGFILELMNRWDEKGGEWVLHNASYDIKVLKVAADYDIPWEKVHDTMIMSRILYPQYKADLKSATDRHVDTRASSGQEELKKEFKKHGWNWNTIPLTNKVYVFYSALDPVLAYNLYQELYPQLAQTDMYKVYDLEMGVLRTMVGCEFRGIKVDLDYVQQMKDEYTLKVEQGTKEVEDRWDVSISANTQLVRKFTELGARFTQFTDSGAKSVNEDQMIEFMSSDVPDVSELATRIVEIRGMSKMVGSYFKNFIDYEQGGYLHPNINTLQAISGRMSITKPALQTLHSDDSIVRNSFIANQEDHLICSADYDQMELRLLAHLSGDPALITAFHNADSTGSDFFTEMAKDVYKDPNFKKSDPRRAQIKTFVYSSMFGAGISKMAKSAGVSVAEMQEISEKVFTSFPGFKTFAAQQMREAEVNLGKTGLAYVTLDSGRRMPVDKDKIYKATNQSIQSLGAELLKRAIMRLDMSGLGEYILLPIHDEILFSIPKDRTEELFPLINDCMSFDQGEFKVNLTAGTEIKGYRWGEAYEK